MRAINVKIKGKEYKAVFNLRVLSRIEEKTGKAAGSAIDEILNSGKIDAYIWLLSEILSAGTRRARMDGEQCEDAPSYDDLLDMLDYDDIEEMSEAIKSAILQKQRIEAQPPKKTEAAR